MFVGLEKLCLYVCRIAENQAGPEGGVNVCVGLMKEGWVCGGGVVRGRI